MDVEVARWLVSAQADAAMEQARTFEDPSSLRAGTTLRRSLSPDRAAAVLDLESLRRRARAKLGDQASHLFLTHDSWEQATRWDVARWRAALISSFGATHIIDAGCGAGIDALAYQMAGMEVVGIERDPMLAIFAEANLRRTDSPTSPTSPNALVLQADLTDHVDILNSQPDTSAIFLDPSRRTTHGRSWDIGDLSPSWEFVCSVLMKASGPVIVKLAPGFPHRLIPDNLDVTWVSHRGDLVETTLWSWTGASGRREAVILESPTKCPPYTSLKSNRDGISESRLIASDQLPPPGPIGQYIYEPDPAVIRAHAIPTLARLIGAHPVSESIAYLSGEDLLLTPFATAFKVLDTMDFSEKTLRAWVHAHEIGILEIKIRGLDVDPAAFRRTLHLRGKNSASVILTPTLKGAQALVVQRLAGDSSPHPSPA